MHAGEAPVSVPMHPCLPLAAPPLLLPPPVGQQYVHITLYVRNVLEGADEGAVEGRKEQQSQSRSTWDSLARGAHWPS